MNCKKYRICLMLLVLALLAGTAFYYMTNGKEAGEPKDGMLVTGSYFRGKQELRMSAGNTLYLKIGKNIVVTDRRVTLGDVAKMECTDQAALRQIRQKKLYSFRAEDDKKKKNTLVVFSVLKVIELIHEDYPNLDISNEGESDFIVEYVKSPEKPVWMNCLKTVILCILIFFGAALRSWLLTMT